MSEQKIKSIEKGWGQTSTYYQVNDNTSYPNRVSEIKEEVKLLGKGEHCELSIIVYRGYIEGKIVFEIAANSDITLTFF